jgi:hypothetical protein
MPDGSINGNVVHSHAGRHLMRVSSAWSAGRREHVTAIAALFAMKVAPHSAQVTGFGTRPALPEMFRASPWSSTDP